MKRINTIKTPRKVKEYIEDIDFNKVLKCFELSKICKYR